MGCPATHCSSNQGLPSQTRPRPGFLCLAFSQREWFSVIIFVRVCKPLLTRCVSLWRAGRPETGVLLCGLVFNPLIYMTFIFSCEVIPGIQGHSASLEPEPERANIAPVPRDKHRLPGRQSGTSQDASHQDDEQEIEGVGTKEWAAQAAPFFACDLPAPIKKTRTGRVLVVRSGV